ncbi:MAG: ATP-grasp domain-containing protein, partial [Candidatus Polarisedimenticolia bacterium]
MSAAAPGMGAGLRGATGRPRVGILATGDRWHVAALSGALVARGCDAVLLDATGLAGGAGGGTAGVTQGPARLEDLDALLVRFIPAGSLDQIVFRIDLLHLLADAGLPVINPPRALERTVDKHWTTRLLHDAGLPTPRTVAAEDEAEAMAAFESMGDVVVKPLLGAGGRGICRVGDPDLAWRTFRALTTQRAVFYVQEFVPHGTSDLRFLVAGGRVIAAARRTGESWKTNVAAGARATAHAPSPEQEELAIRACRAVGADYAGIDLIEAEDGRLLVVEVNGIP